MTLKFTTIIRQTYSNLTKRWIEENMCFDSDSFDFLKALIKREEECLGGKYTLVRTY